MSPNDISPKGPTVPAASAKRDKRLSPQRDPLHTTQWGSVMVPARMDGTPSLADSDHSASAT